MAASKKFFANSSTAGRRRRAPGRSGTGPCRGRGWRGTRLRVVEGGRVHVQGDVRADATRARLHELPRSVKRAQCANPTVCAPETAAMSRALRLCLENVAARSLAGTGSLPATWPALETKPSNRPSSTAQCGRVECRNQSQSLISTKWFSTNPLKTFFAKRFSLVLQNPHFHSCFSRNRGSVRSYYRDYLTVNSKYTAFTSKSCQWYTGLTLGRIA
jgi:hypothetical protein